MVRRAGLPLYDRTMPFLGVPTAARVPLVATALLASVLLSVTACTTTTDGVGWVRARAATGPTTTVPGSGSQPVNPGGPNLPAPSTGAPPGCRADTCQLRLSASLDAPYGIAVWATDAGRTTFVTLTNGGAQVSSSALVDESPAQLSCLASAQRPNCVLVDRTGVHGSVARILRHAGGALVVAATAQVATPTMQSVDLNRDGWVDVAGLQNDETPSYASGQLYWQTWLSDGVRFIASGCGPKSSSAPGAPSAPLTGHCG